MRERVLILSVCKDRFERQTTAVVQLLLSNAVLKCQVVNVGANLHKGQHATLSVCAYNPPFLQVNLEHDSEQDCEQDCVQHCAQDFKQIEEKGTEELLEESTSQERQESKPKRPFFTVIES
jgi:hypothetical protein